MVYLLDIVSVDHNNCWTQQNDHIKLLRRSEKSTCRLGRKFCYQQLRFSWKQSFKVLEFEIWKIFI